MKFVMGIDQYGQTYHALGKRPRKELLARLGKTHAEKMYVDLKDSSAKHIGYVISGLWIRLYSVIEFEGEGGEISE